MRPETIPDSCLPPRHTGHADFQHPAFPVPLHLRRAQPTLACLDSRFRLSSPSFHLTAASLVLLGLLAELLSPSREVTAVRRSVVGSCDPSGSPFFGRNVERAGSLGSTGITLLQRYYEPRRLLCRAVLRLCIPTGRVAGRSHPDRSLRLQ